MKAITVKRLDEKNEEVADALISLGMSRPIAWILSYLKNGNEITAVELDRGTGLRQPKVSIAMRELKENGWISEREEKKPGKGRPYKIYKLKVGFNEVITQLEKQQRKAVDKIQANIKRLKDLGNITPS